MSDQQQQSTSPPSENDMERMNIKQTLKKLRDYKLIIELYEQNTPLREKIYFQELDTCEQKLKALEAEKIELERDNIALILDYEETLENERQQTINKKNQSSQHTRTTWK